MAEYLFDASRRRVAGVRPGAVLVVAGDDAATTVGELWPTLSADATTAVIERLTARGLGNTPDFALVTWTRQGAADLVRVLVRGEFEVTVGGTRISGVGVSTWTERVLDAAAEFAIEALGAEAGDDWLPIIDGIVTAGRVAVPAHAASSVADPPALAAAPTAPVTDSAAPPTTPHALPAPAIAPAAETPVEATAVVAASEQTIAPLVEETVTDFIEPIPGPSSPSGSSSGQGDQAEPGDHDGLTIASVDIRRLRAEREAAKVSHAAPMPADDTDHARSQAPQPQPHLRMPDGALEPIGHEVVLGRAPSISKVSGGRLPRLVTIGHGDPDISRSHVRLALEGGTVVITDLHSRNGTLVVAPGKPPVKLRAGEPTPVLIGTVVDLGGGCTLQVVGR